MTSSKVTTAIRRPPASVIVVPETRTVIMPAAVSQSTCTWLSVSPRAARTAGISSVPSGRPEASKSR